MCDRQVWCQKSVQWAVVLTQPLWPEVSALDPLLVDSQTEGYEGESEMMSSRASQIVFHHRLHAHIPHPSLHVAILESATSRSGPLHSTRESSIVKLNFGKQGEGAPKAHNRLLLTAAADLAQPRAKAS